MDVLMPQLGETVTEGKITVWFKALGDPIAPGDNLFEIETDKVTMEVPSTTAGILKEIRVQQGEVAPVNAVVAVTPDRAIPAPQPMQVNKIRIEAFHEVRTPERNFGSARLANGVRVS